MIASIYLENFKTHLSSTLNFSIGTNLLIGKVGSGKSSITDGICYALFGTFPSLSNKKLKTTDIIMFKPIRKDSSKIKLVINLNSKAYRIEREITDKANTTAKLYLDNKLIAGPKQTDVTLKVEELLGVDYDLFTKIVYSEQNELDYFLKIQPSKRKERFDDLFGILKLDNIKDGARALDRLLENEINTTTQLISQVNSQLLSSDLKTKLIQEKETIQIIDDLKKEHISENNKERDLISELAIQRKKKEEFDFCITELISRTAKLEDIENYLTKNKLDDNYFNIAIIDVQKEKASLDLEFEKTKQEINKKNKLINELSSYEYELKRIEFELIENKKQLISIKNAISSPLSELIVSQKTTFDDLSKKLQEKITISSLISELDKSISELKKGFLKCPICDSQLSREDIQKRLISKNETLMLQKQNMETIINEIYQLKQKEDEIEKQIIKQKETELKQKQLDSIIIQNQKRKDEILSKKLLLTNQINVIKEDDSHLQKIIAKQNQISLFTIILEKTEGKKKLLEEKKTIEEKQKTINYKEEEYIKINSIYINLENTIKSLNERINTTTSLLDNIKKQIITIQKLVSQEKEQETKKENLLIKKQDISNFIKSIEVSQHQLRKVLIDNINDALSIIWPKVYPYKDYLSARLRSDNDYILEVQTKSKEWIKVEGFLSGGERACAALSIRIAISLILTKNLGLLILDEPTHNLDTRAVEMLSKVLEEDIPQYIPQTIIITHDAKLLETLNSHNYIIERDKENDGISEIKEQ